MMHGHEKSDSVIVAVKPANKAVHPAAEQSAAEVVAAEPGEPRAETKGNADQQTMPWAQSQTSMPRALERIRQVNAVMTRGGSRMRESRSYGSVRGAREQSASLPLRAPGKLVRSSRWKSGPSKGQRPLGSECCVAAGGAWAAGGDAGDWISLQCLTCAMGAIRGRIPRRP